MRRIMFPLAIVAAVAPATVSAQVTGAASAVSTTQATATTPTANAAANAAAEARINAAIQSATEAGVPAQLLVNKVVEGRAKGVAMTRIAAAVEHRAEVLTRVHNILAEGNATAKGSAVTTGELVAAADAHQGGVSLENIAKLSARAGNDRAMALTVLADLVASGRTPEHAMIRVQNALQAGGNALVELGSSTSAAVRAGAPGVNVGTNGTSKVEAGRNGTSVRTSGTTTIKIGG